MAVYNTKMAIADIGFIYGFFFMQPDHPNNESDLEWILDVFQRVKDFVAGGSLLLDSQADPAATSAFLCELGLIRGLLWSEKLPYAVASAISQVIDHCTGNGGMLYDAIDSNQQPDPEADWLSERQRDAIMSAAIAGNDTTTAEFAQSISASHRVILDLWCREGVISNDEAADRLAAATHEELTSPRPTVTVEQTMKAAPPAPESPLSEQAVPIPVDQKPIARNTYEWPVEDKEKLVAMCAAHPEWTWRQIGKEMGRTGPQCSSMHYAIKKKQGGSEVAQKDDPPKTPVVHDGDDSHPLEIDTVQDMLDQDLSYEEIGRNSGCTEDGVWKFCQANRLVPASKVNPGVQEVSAEAPASIAATPPMISGKPDGGRTVGTEPVPEDEYAGEREDRQLLDSDWPDIRRMLDSRLSEKTIAAKYRVDEFDLSYFIRKQRTRDADNAVCAGRKADRPEAASSRKNPGWDFSRDNLDLPKDI